MNLILLYLTLAVPVPTYPVDKIIGTWEYEDETWPGVKFILVLLQNKDYRWKATVEDDNGDPKLWDSARGEWTYDGKKLRLLRHKKYNHMQFTIHAASEKDTLKCHLLKGIFGEERDIKLNLYRAK